VSETITVRRALEQSGLIPVDARALLSHVTGRDRAWLIAHASDPLARPEVDRFFALAKRRREGEPVAYLVGRQEFWGLDLVVTPAVLIPRPETETLVEAALARLPADRPLRILDLGSGSGAIALALARERPQAQVVGTDVSPDALAVAASNAQRLEIANVVFLRADWFAGVPDGRFDAIVSNPPYVADGDAHLGEGDLRFEPRVALAPGGDGFAALNAIVFGASRHLTAGGWLIVEHGHDQSGPVQAMFGTAGFDGITPLRDLAGIPRVVAGRNP
jgi:release factor glutamine methyltransferase